MTAKDLADFLRLKALGAENAKTASDILDFFEHEVNDRELRMIAAEAVEAGLPVIGGPRGYFYARTREEAEGAIKRLESHAKAELHHASLLKKMLDNAAQTHLFTPAEA